MAVLIDDLRHAAMAVAAAAAAADRGTAISKCCPEGPVSRVFRIHIYQLMASQTRGPDDSHHINTVFTAACVQH